MTLVMDVGPQLVSLVHDHHHHISGRIVHTSKPHPSRISSPHDRNLGPPGTLAHSAISRRGRHKRLVAFAQVPIELKWGLLWRDILQKGMIAVGNLTP